MVDICSWVLCRDVAGGAPEDRVDKVFLLKEHALVVRAFPFVVKGEDAREFRGKKVIPFVLLHTESYSWVELNGTAGPVPFLQLSSATGS